MFAREKKHTHTYTHTHPTKGSKQSSSTDSTGVGLLAPKYEATMCSSSSVIQVDKFENKKVKKKNKKQKTKEKHTISINYIYFKRILNGLKYFLNNFFWAWSIME